MNPPPALTVQDGVFPNTQWSLIRLSQDAANPEAVAALDRLARAYWRPLYKCVRAMGSTHEQAEDEVQRLFEALVSRDSLRRVVPGETRFRTFMIACLKNSLASSARARLAQKRGAGVETAPLDEALPADTGLPEETMDREWAREADAARRGRAAALAVLRPLLRGEAVAGGYAVLAERLGVAEATARKMVFDLRARLGVPLKRSVLLYTTPSSCIPH